MDSGNKDVFYNPISDVDKTTAPLVKPLSQKSLNAKKSAAVTENGTVAPSKTTGVSSA